MPEFNAKQLRAYFICGTQDLPTGKSLPELVEAALKAGITAYQFRDKGPKSTLSKQDRLPLAQELHQLCQKYHVPFFVDDDVELAKEVNAEGIHVGQDDEDISRVIRTVHGKMIVGYSCSTSAEIRLADQISGIDYYGSGPVFATQSKDDADPVIGLDGLAKLVHQTDRPIVAIGGIEEKDLFQIAHTKAAGAAVISMIAQSSDIEQTVASMLNADWQYN